MNETQFLCDDPGEAAAAERGGVRTDHEASLEGRQPREGRPVTPPDEHEDEKGVERWILRLYVAGMTPAARCASANIQKICREHLADRYTIEVIDLLEKPQLVEGEQIFAVPTLVRKLPPTVRKLLGDLSATEKVLVGLDLKPKR